ncbi:rhomboid family intramembrane serine protease [Akkermansiaceae bacterium]|nr:rhomboid family intramembrane serine protease [Akkermansiaceae bacterium]MDB4434067.1 rhomboid family intramembrane serine protease [Akkermansiaceae bacterium]
MRQGPGQGPGASAPRPPGHFDGAPVAKFLLIANVAIYLLGNFLMKDGQHSAFAKWGAFSITEGFYDFQIWRVLTFQFLHADSGHLLGNMLGMFFFAPHVERWMGSRPFTFYYFLCGIAGVVFYSFLYFTPGIMDQYAPYTRMVGASAGLFGILAAFYKIAPNAKVYLFFIIPMPMRVFAMGYFAIQVLSVLFNWDNAGGSAGHLGGALFGLALIKYQPLRSWLIRISEIGQKGGGSRVKTAKIVRERSLSPIEQSKEVDRILEKISAHGIQSLTDKERETLDKARRK